MEKVKKLYYSLLLGERENMNDKNYASGAGGIGSTRSTSNGLTKDCTANCEAETSQKNESLIYTKYTVFLPCVGFIC